MHKRVAWTLAMVLAIWGTGCPSGSDSGTAGTSGSKDKSRSDAGAGSSAAAGSGSSDNGKDAGATTDSGPSGGQGADASSDGGGSAATVDTSCTGILTCVGDCPDSDDTCPDACYAVGDSDAQDQFVALLDCMDTNQCSDVPCIQSMCANELVACVSPSSPSGGSPVTGPAPQGDIPAELVGHWVRPSADEVFELTFGADGSASHANYKESTLASCTIAVMSEWSTGSVVAQGDELTVTLEEGVTNVTWVGGCGSDYTNPAPGTVLHYRYALDTGDQPGLWLTDLDCQGDYCEELYRLQ